MNSTDTSASPLYEYTHKRDFQKTDEPKAALKSKNSGDYMIHLHDATRLHYDLRLQWKGVLKCWAVPKGPSLNPRDKRLAVRTEDHPDDYKNYEGVIPEHHYGAGPSLIWDAGIFTPLEDFDEGFRKGHLRFKIDGVKLKGAWSLIEMKGQEKESWLLIKEHDEFANTSLKVKEMPESVATGRTLEDLTTGERAPSVSVQLTHAQRVLYPHENITKDDVWNYYERVLPEFLKFSKKAPLTLVRCPRGLSKDCFFQKHFDVGEAHIPLIKIKEEKKTGIYGYVESSEDVKSLVQLGVLEFHIWNSRTPEIEAPKYLVFDLDPSEGSDFERVVEAAHLLRGILKELNKKTYVRTTGGKGLHVLTACSEMSWEKAHEFSKQIAEGLAKARPAQFVSQSSKAKRKGKIFVDYLRNTRGATAIANFSTRAKDKATVATPLHWEEVTKDLNPQDFTVKTIPKRLSQQRRDPWEKFLKELKL